MGNKGNKHKNKKPVEYTPSIQKSKTIYKKTNLSDVVKDNLIWLDAQVKNVENEYYQEEILNLNRFELFTFTKIKDCISKLKEIEFKKTYIIISGSLSTDFFIEFEKIINEIKICPIIIIFTSPKTLNLIKKNIISLDKFSLFDINLVFDDFYKVRSQLLLKDLYQPHYIAPNKYDEKNTCFSFEYINELKDLILPLTFIEFMEIPNKMEIIDFNQYLLDKYSNKSQMKNLIEQLLIDVKIPFQILVKYWIRAYTFETLFYKEMNYSLLTRIGNDDYDIYIRTLYQGLSTNAIKPLIDETLYRGAVIQLD